MQALSPTYMFFYTFIFTLLVGAVGAYFLRRTYHEALDEYFNDDDDDDGGWYTYNELPDVPLPPGISRPINDWEPEYNKRKEYA